MTSPAAPAPAPQVTQDTSARFMDDVLSSIASESVKASLPPEEPAQPEAPKTPAPQGEAVTREDGATWNASANRWQKDGKFVAGEAPKTPDAAVVPEGEQPAEPETAKPVELPEGFVAVPKIEGRELATQFVLLDAEGEIEIPDVKVKFQGGGKERLEPLDKVVKLAQWGYSNQEREAKYEQTRVQAETAERTNVELTTKIREMEQEREKLLSDPDFLIQTLTQFEAQNTPEAKLARVEKERKQENEQRQFREMSDQGERFFNSEMVPAVETMSKALPLVSEEEIGAKLLLISNRFLVSTPLGNVIPPTQHQNVRQAVLNELVPWAQQLQDTRESDRRNATKDIEQKKKEAEDKARTAQTEAQKAKRLVGRVVKPGSTSPTGTAARPTPTPQPIKTVQDAESAALRDTMAAMGITA